MRNIINRLFFQILKMNKYSLCALILLFANTFAIANNDKKYNEIIENLRCLVCQNQSLSESDSNLAKDLRNKVKDMLQIGRTEEEIYKYMSDRYTDYVLYNPPLKKSTWFLWYSPFIILLISLIYLIFLVRKKNISSNENFNMLNDNKIESLDTNYKSIKLKYIYIFLLAFIPITSAIIYSYSSEYMNYKISSYFESKEPIINITVSIHDKILSKITGNEILFVYARKSSGMRIPLAINVIEINNMKKNYNVELNNTMSMVENQTLSTANEVVIEARISKTMKAMASPGDFIGISEPLKINSSNYLLLKINSIVTEEK